MQGSTRRPGTSLPETENPLEARVVQPARRHGVPCPSSPSHVGRLGIDVRGDGVRLHFAFVDVRLTVRTADGVQEVEQIDRFVSFAHLGESDDRRDRGVGVLPAVLPDSRRVSFIYPGSRIDSLFVTSAHFAEKLVGSQAATA